MKSCEADAAARCLATAVFASEMTQSGCNHPCQPAQGAAVSQPPHAQARTRRPAAFTKCIERARGFAALGKHRSSFRALVAGEILQSAANEPIAPLLFVPFPWTVLLPRERMLPLELNQPVPLS